MTSIADTHSTLHDGEGTPRQPSSIKADEAGVVKEKETSGDSSSNRSDSGAATSPAAVDDGSDWKPSFAVYMVFAALGVCTMMIALDSTSVALALPEMSRELGGTAIEAFWTGTGFLLTCAIFQLPIVSLSHIFGRMPLTIFSIVMFFIGILTAGLAKNFTTVIAGRAVQGIGGGGIFALIDVIVTDVVPMRFRGSYLGLISAVWTLGSTAGPITGGAFAEYVTWRWLFWINMPFVGIAIVVVPIWMRLTATRGTMMQKLKRVDWFGIVFLLGASTSFLIALTWGGVQYPWGSASTLVPLLVGIVAIAGFVVYELYVPVEPCIRVRMIDSYNMSFSLIGALVHTLVVYAYLYFLPLYFQAVKGYDGVISGVAMLSLTIIMAPMSIVSGMIVTKTGDFRRVVQAGWVLLTLGAGLMIILDVNTSIVAYVFIILVGAFGVGSLYSVQNIVNQAAAKDEDQAFAVGLFIFFRTLGQCLGVAVCGVVFQNQMQSKLSNIPALAPHAVDYSRDAQSLVQTIHAMPDNQDKQDLIGAYADSLKIVWAVMCALGGVSMVLSFFMKHASLDRALTTEQALREEKATGGESTTA